jgi:S-adenosylmethionine decarboxylase proenzyme
MRDSSPPYHAALSARFMIASLIACSLLSFSVGKFARFVLEPEFLLPEGKGNYNKIEVEGSDVYMPIPLAKLGKIIPETLYTTKNFDTRRSAVISSAWLQREESSSEENDIPAPKNERLVELNETGANIDEIEEEHLPAGQHLLVDMANIDASFLNSEQQLATAMIQLVDNSGLTLLSYHCHGLKPAGVSCAGVLLESHVAFHTWPAEGVITLDLFTCGSTSLLKHVHLIEGLFAIPQQGVADFEPPKILWAYKRRGFNEQSGNSGSRDTFAYPLGLHGVEMKKEVGARVLISSCEFTNCEFSLFSFVLHQVANVETDQGKQAWIYDVQQPHHPIDVQKDFAYNRLLYLDGVLKSCRLGEAASYESFVHPSMLAHDAPRRVLVLGAGVGASIREVLKHRSVEEVAVVGADKSLLELGREYLQDWIDCSNLVGSQDYCLDDARVKTYYENPTTWLNKSKASNRENSMSFDIIMVDLL